MLKGKIIALSNSRSMSKIVMIYPASSYIHQIGMADIYQALTPNWLGHDVSYSLYNTLLSCLG